MGGRASECSTAWRHLSHIYGEPQIPDCPWGPWVRQERWRLGLDLEVWLLGTVSQQCSSQQHFERDWVGCLSG